MNTKTLFSSNTGDWATPQDFFDQVAKRFRFALDAAASPSNAKCPIFYSLENGDDGLTLPWANTTWLNPPYGRGIGAWIEKAVQEKLKRGIASVLLVPARTDTKWFQLAFRHAAGLWLVPGRLKFGGSKDAAPFPSALFYFCPRVDMPCQVAYWGA